ncbi:MAG: hypothetical protein RMK74_07415, partial [Myxococcales bacterium]|nr:hypothetical protein [Myxococcales bacterium]
MPRVESTGMVGIFAPPAADAATGQARRAMQALLAGDPSLIVALAAREMRETRTQVALGDIAVNETQAAAAQEARERALEAARTSGDVSVETARDLAAVRLAQGRAGDALALLRELA